MMDDPTLLALFARQFGVDSTAQLRDAGVSRSTVNRAIERRTMHHVLPHVVVLNGAELTFEARAMAAVLHGGESGLELDALDAIRRAGLPEPARQHRLVVASGRNIHLDLAWPDRRLAVEPGHSWWHGGNQRMRADYARDRACSELGWHIVRFDESMRHDLDDTGRQLRRIYDARSATTFASDVTRKW